MACIKTVVPLNLSNASYSFATPSGFIVHPKKESRRGLTPACNARLSARNSSARLLAFAASASAEAPTTLATAIFPAASILYRSNSLLDAAISMRCNLTTAHVAAPAISAEESRDDEKHHHRVFPTR